MTFSLFDDANSRSHAFAEREIHVHQLAVNIEPKMSAAEVQEDFMDA
jgi:hypothetical protein